MYFYDETINEQFKSNKATTRTHLQKSLENQSRIENPEKIMVTTNPLE